MIRVVLPAPLQSLAGVGRELLIEVDGAVTQRNVVDRIEACYPALSGTLRDPLSQQRRPFIRFFACETDLSHESPDALLPAEVAAGDEPLFIVGAMAGG